MRLLSCLSLQFVCYFYWPKKEFLVKFSFGGWGGGGGSRVGTRPPLSEFSGSDPASGKHQHGRLGVKILLRVRCRKKHIFLVFSERNFFFNSKSAAPEPIQLKFGQLIVIQLSSKTVSAIFLFFPFSNNRHFFKGSADELSPPTLSYCDERTNERIKNLRHGFLVERVRGKKQMRCLSLSSAHSQRDWR